jgi:hypothetical protein
LPFAFRQRVVIEKQFRALAQNTVAKAIIFNPQLVRIQIKSINMLNRIIALILIIQMKTDF